MAATLEDEQINLRPTSGRGDLNKATTTSTASGTAVGHEHKHTSAHAPIHANLRIHADFAKKRNNRDPNPSKITTLAGTVIVDDPALLGPTVARATAGKTLTAGISPRAVSEQHQCARRLAPDSRNGKIIKNSGGASITIDGFGVGSKIIAGGGDDDTIVKFAPVAVLDQHQRSGGTSSESFGVVFTHGCGDQTIFTVSEQCIATHGTVDVDDCNQAMKENCPTVNTTTNGAAESNLGRMEEENNTSGCVFVHCDGREDRAGLVKTVKVVDLAQSNKNGSECATGSKCNTRPVILLTGSIAACMVVMAFLSYNANHFCDDYNTSNNHAIRASNELVVDSGGSTSQRISNGAMCLTVAISAVCLVFMTCLIHCVYAIDSR
jgi:hypothetical protein